MISWYCIWSGHPKIYPEWLGFEGNGSGGVGELCDSLSRARSAHCFPTFSIFCLSCRWKVIVCVVRLLSTGKPLECQVAYEEGKNCIPPQIVLDEWILQKTSIRVTRVRFPRGVTNLWLFIFFFLVFSGI